MMTIGEKIRKVRDFKGYSQENMADVLGIALQTYGDLERDSSKITVERLTKIAEILGTTAAKILTADEQISNFFDHCNSVNGVGVNHIGTQNNNLDNMELRHALETAQLLNDKLKVEKEKAEFEAKYWKEKYENKQ